MAETIVSHNRLADAPQVGRIHNQIVRHPDFPSALVREVAMDLDLTILAASASVMALVGSALPLAKAWFGRKMRARVAMWLPPASDGKAGTAIEALVINVGGETFRIDVNDIDKMDTAELQRALVSVREAQALQKPSAA